MRVHTLLHAALLFLVLLAALPHAVYAADPPTCVVNVSPTAYTYPGSATVTWSSSNGTSLYIQNIGYVSSNGSASVWPGDTTDYSGFITGPGGSAWCTGDHNLTVTQYALCSLSVAPSTVNQPDTATLSWTNDGSTSFYITNIGYVTPNQSGSTTVGPSQTTTYTGTAEATHGSDFNATCSTTLNVNRACSLPWGGTITHGQSVTAYQASAVSYGTSCVSQSRSCSDGTLSGTYQYSSCSVSPPATCTLDGETVQDGDSFTFFSLQTAPSGSTCTGSGGGSDYSQSRTCTNGTLSGSGSYHYSSCSCTPSYTCSDSTIQHTDAACAVTNVVTCESPGFCSTGSATCLYPPPAFNQGAGNLSGHLEARPQLVAPGSTAHVYWNISNVSSCTISAQNGDSWTGAAAGCSGGICTSGASGKETSPIEQNTIYTLSCTALDSSSIQESATVSITPVFEER